MKRLGQRASRVAAGITVLALVAWDSRAGATQSLLEHEQLFAPDLIFKDGFDPDSPAPCDPDGLYVKTGLPIAYTCCMGLITINIDRFTFSNDGANITTAPSNPALLVGTATSCPSGAFDNSASEAGGCTVTYDLTGAFLAENSWSGTYALGFIGSACSCSGFGTPCMNQSWSVTATR